VGRAKAADPAEGDPVRATDSMQPAATTAVSDPRSATATSVGLPMPAWRAAILAWLVIRSWDDAGGGPVTTPG
jgi:hypothetical protein